MSHRYLADQMLSANGGVCSEWPPGVAPKAYLFPIRNRIISGLSDITWVVQGTYKSGSCHTARFAAEQGRVVMASPGDVFSELAVAPNRLLQDGAHAVLSGEDIDQMLALSSEKNKRAVH